MTFRQASALFFIAALLALLVFPVCACGADAPFDDVKAGAWYYDAAQYAKDNGFMKGVGKNSFDPEGYVDRAMFVTMLYRMDGAAKVSAGCPFSDVAPGSWYEESVAWAAANGIVNGAAASRFCPSDRISREETAAICYRYAQYKGYDVSKKEDFSSFKDAGQVQDWAKDAIAWSRAAGLINGVGGNALAPRGLSTRAQAAAMLMRFEKNVTLQQADTVALPVLTYHDVAQGASETVISPQLLETHLAALRKAGYHTILPSELRDYVHHGASLPEKPLLITFDDGYLSNATVAYPLLKKYNMKAAFFIIGVTFGSSTYKDTGKAIVPHFGAKEAAALLDSGRVELGSHTFDLHQWRPYEKGPEVRENVKRLPSDTDAKYLTVLRDDARRFADLYRAATGETTDIFSYPRGAVTEEAAAVLREAGYSMTFCSERGVNTIVRGLPRCLTGLRRYNVDGDMTADDVLDLIGR